MITVSVDIAYLDDALENKIQTFNLTCLSDNYEWKTIRTSSDFYELEKDLKITDTVFPKLNVSELSKEHLESFISTVLEFHQKDPWKFRIIEEFLVGCGNYIDSKKTISDLTSQVKELQANVEDLQIKYKEITQILTSMQMKKDDFSVGSSPAIHVKNLESDSEASAVDFDSHQKAVPDSETASRATYNSKDISPLDPTGIFSPATPSTDVLTSGIFTTNTTLSGHSVTFPAVDECLSVLNQVQVYDSAVDEMLQVLRPGENQLQYRASVVSFLKKQIRIALGCNAFEVGLHELHCFLPDDPVRLTVVKGRDVVDTWHRALNDRLQTLAENPVMTSAEAVNTEREDLPDAIFSQFRVLVDHKVSNVNTASDSVKFMVTCAVDKTNVTVVYNAREDLCLLTFFEEVSQLVGKDQLFKRSMLLIRAWWLYDTTAYMNHPMSHYIPEFAFCIMVVAVFNQYHKQINSPMQALTLFLVEYANFDVNAQIVTIQGIIDLRESTNGTRVTPLQGKDTDLLSADQLDVFWQLFNVNDSVDPTIGILTNTSSSDDLNSLRASQGARKALKSVRIDRTGFNVLNPFTLSNMIPKKLSARRLALVQMAFRAGSNQTYQLAQKASNPLINVIESIQKLLPVTNRKYILDLSRPDAIGGSVNPTPESEIIRTKGYRIDSQSQVEGIRLNLLYCNFLLKSVVSESALFTLCHEILEEKQFLPVGEVGKILAELTSTPSITQKLREKFGGLKRFLERYPRVFVFLQDHQFNPTVILKDALLQEDIDLVSRGMSLPDLLKHLKNRKAGVRSPLPGAVPGPPNPNSPYWAPSNSRGMSGAAGDIQSTVSGLSHDSTRGGNWRVGPPVNMGPGMGGNGMNGYEGIRGSVPTRNYDNLTARPYGARTTGYNPGSNQPSRQSQPQSFFSPAAGFLPEQGLGGGSSPRGNWGGRGRGGELSDFGVPMGGFGQSRGGRSGQYNRNTQSAHGYDPHESLFQQAQEQQMQQHLSTSEFPHDSGYFPPYYKDL